MKISKIFSKVLSDREICDLEMIVDGGFDPIDRYLDNHDHEAVLETMRLADGQLWPIPIDLILNNEEKARLGSDDKILLKDSFGRNVAEVEVFDIYRFEALRKAQAIFCTTDRRHPYIDLLSKEDGKWRVSGRIKALEHIKHNHFSHLRRSPAETRRMLLRAGWGKVIAFQTRNPLHRSHFQLTLTALEEAGEDAGLLLHPVVGPTQPNDVPPRVRVACYERILHRYPLGRATLSLLPLSMRMAGPREALWHALIRKTYGATHFIVGRDHAGPSNKTAEGNSFFDPYEAQELLATHADEIGITPIFSQEIAYYPDLNSYLPIDKAPAGMESYLLSGTKQREILSNGEILPEWFTFPEVASVLSEHYKGRPVKNPILRCG